MVVHNFDIERVSVFPGEAHAELIRLKYRETSGPRWHYPEAEDLGFSER